MHGMDLIPYRAHYGALVPPPLARRGQSVAIREHTLRVQKSNKNSGARQNKPRHDSLHSGYALSVKGFN
jgi:hypothetical protein